MQDFYINNVKIDLSQISKYSYLQSIKAITKIENLTFEKPVIIFTGENGSGKSTILEAIAKNYGFNEEGRSLNMKFETYNDTSELNKSITLAILYEETDSYKIMEFFINNKESILNNLLTDS